MISLQPASPTITKTTLFSPETPPSVFETTRAFNILTWVEECPNDEDVEIANLIPHDGIRMVL